MAVPTTATSAPPPSADVARSIDGARWARMTLLAVALLFFVGHLTIFPVDSSLSWDEAVYVSQVTVGEPAVFFDEHRSRGMPLLVAPVAMFDPPMVVLRLWMAALLSVGLFAAFATWVRTVPWAAPAGAAVFVLLWSAFYFSATLYPNYPAALAILGAVGSFVSHMLRGRRADLVAAAVWLLLAGLLRPSDAGLAGVGVAATALVLWRGRAIRPLVILALGGLAGVGAWFVEGLVRFGLWPWQLMTGAMERSTGGPSPNQLPLYLANLEGPLRCRGACRAAFLDDPGWMAIPGRSALWLTVLAMLVLLGLAWGDAAVRRTLTVAAAVCVPLLLFYARSGSAVNQRYLLPVFALVALAAGAGLATVGARAAAGRRGAVAVCVVVGLLAVPWTTAQVRMAHAEMQASQQHRDRAETLGGILVDRAASQPCAVASAASYPQIQHWSGCLAVQLRRQDDGRLQNQLGTAHSKHDLRALAEQGYRVFVVAKRLPPPSSPVHEWPTERIDSDVLGRYQIWWLPEDGSLLPPDPR